MNDGGCGAPSRKLFRLVFLGTGSFAVPSLRALAEGEDRLAGW